MVQQVAVAEIHLRRHRACRRRTREASLGDDCRLHVECASGYCQTSAGCPGTCLARKPESAACSSSAECLSGVCDGTCVVGSVVTTGLAAGAACSEESPDQRLCAQGLWCNPSAGKCQSPIAAGDVCHDDDDVCETGHVCVPVGAMMGADREWRCLRLDVQSVGEPCDSARSATGDTFRVCDLLWVDVCVDGLCVHHPQGRAGDPCGRTDVGNTCAFGLACQDSVCVALLADGAECSGSGECLGRCNFETGHCETPAFYCEEPL